MSIKNLIVRGDVVSGVHNVYLKGRIKFRVDADDNFRVLVLCGGLKKLYWRQSAPGSKGAALARTLVMQHLGML